MGRDTGVPVTSEVDCGTVESERRPLLLAASYILDDIQDVAAAAALVYPAAQWFYPRVLGQLTSLHPLYLADPSEEYLAWQRQQVGDRGLYCRADGVAELPEEIGSLGVVLNPFGLQHHPTEVSQYAPALLPRCQEDCVLLTLDWGRMQYPADIAGLPGIAGEVRFNEQSLLTAFGQETGWRLAKAREIHYGVQHSLAELAGHLYPDFARQLPGGDAQREDIFTVRSTMIYRMYRRFSGD